MSGKKSRSMIFSMAATYVSSSRTLCRRFLEAEFVEIQEEMLSFSCLTRAEELGFGVWAFWDGDGDGVEMWRGEWPGDNNILGNDRRWQTIKVMGGAKIAGYINENLMIGMSTRL